MILDNTSSSSSSNSNSNSSNSNCNSSRRLCAAEVLAKRKCACYVSVYMFYM